MRPRSSRTKRTSLASTCRTFPNGFVLGRCFKESCSLVSPLVPFERTRRSPPLNAHDPRRSLQTRQDSLPIPGPMEWRPPNGANHWREIRSDRRHPTDAIEPPLPDLRVLIAQKLRNGEGGFIRTRSLIRSNGSGEMPPSKVEGHAGGVMSAASGSPRTRRSPVLLHEAAETAVSEARRDSYVSD